MTRLQVGDQGHIYYSHRGAKPVAATVTKVGRKWATVTVDMSSWATEQADIEHGWLNDKGGAPFGIFRTPAQQAAHEQVQASRAVIREAGLEFRVGNSSKWPDAQVNALAAWITETADNE